MLESIPGWAGTLPQWITAVSSAGILTALGIIVRWQLGNRKLKVEADRVGIEGRKVDFADEESLRAHWSKEVARLQEQAAAREERFQDALDKQSQRHNAALTALEERHGRAMLFMEERQVKCEQERERIGTRLQTAESELTGLKKQMSIQSADQLMILDAAGSDKVKPEALAAAKRLIEQHRLEHGEGAEDER